MARRKQQKPWQYTLTFALSGALFLLIIGFLLQSYQSVRELQPIRIAVERLNDGPQEGTRR